MFSPHDAHYVNALKAVQEKYVLRGNQEEIVGILQTHPPLVTVLVEAHRNLMKYFPNNPPVFLTLGLDPETRGFDQLIASVDTNLEPGEALDALATFDEKWWTGSLKWADGKLCITLE